MTKTTVENNDDHSEGGEEYEPRLGNLLWHLRNADHAMERTLRRMLKDTNITKAQFGAMQVLNEVTEASSAALARMLDVSPQSVVDLVASLARKGYLERETVISSSGRMITAQLTPSGNAAFAEVAERFEQIDERLATAYTADERSQFIEFLARMQRVLDLHGS